MLEALNHHFVPVGLNFAKQRDVKPEDDFLEHIKPVRDIMKFKAIDEGYVLNAISRFEKGKHRVRIKCLTHLYKMLANLFRTH